MDENEEKLNLTELLGNFLELVYPSDGRNGDGNVEFECNWCSAGEEWKFGALGDKEYTVFVDDILRHGAMHHTGVMGPELRKHVKPVTVESKIEKVIRAELGDLLAEHTISDLVIELAQALEEEK